MHSLLKLFDLTSLYIKDSSMINIIFVYADVLSFVSCGIREKLMVFTCWRTSANKG
jgi:hypothetical protein